MAILYSFDCTGAGNPAQLWALVGAQFNVPAQQVIVTYSGWISQAAYSQRLNSMPGQIMQFVLNPQDDGTFAADGGATITLIETAILGDLISQPDNIFHGAIEAPITTFIPLGITDVISTPGPSDGTLALSWTVPVLAVNASAATSYAVAVSTNITGPWTPTTITTTTNNTIITGLSPGNYYTQITPRNSSGNGPVIVSGPFTIT